MFISFCLFIQGWGMARGAWVRNSSGHFLNVLSSRVAMSLCKKPGTEKKKKVWQVGKLYSDHKSAPLLHPTCPLLIRVISTTSSRGNLTWRCCRKDHRRLQRSKWTFSCFGHLKQKKNLNPCTCVVFLFCFFKSQHVHGQITTFSSLWIIFWKMSYPSRTPPCYQVSTDFQQEEISSFHICKSSKVVTLTCSHFL